MEIDAGVVQGDGVAASLLAGSNQATANRAKAILCKSPGFRDVTSAERSAIAAAFAARGFVVYGKAFDLVRIDELDADLANPTTLDATITARQLTLIEVKSTSANRDSDFRGHFFSMSTAELLVAQSLGELFKFAFVNTTTEAFRVVTLQDVYARAKAIYPTCRFGSTTAHSQRARPETGREPRAAPGDFTLETAGRRERLETHVPGA